MALQQRPQGGDRRGVRLLHKEDAVGIAHGHAVHRQGLLAPGQAQPHHRGPRQMHRNRRGAQHGTAHVHPGGHETALFAPDLDPPGDAAGFQGQAVPVPQPPLSDVARHAPGGVAAHLALAAVGVEDAHGKIRDPAGADQHQPVRADAPVPVAQAHGKGRRIRHPLLKGVDIEVVIAQPLHLGEAHPHPSPQADFPPIIPPSPGWGKGNTTKGRKAEARGRGNVPEIVFLLDFLCHEMYYAIGRLSPCRRNAFLHEGTRRRRRH